MHVKKRGFIVCRQNAKEILIVNLRNMILLLPQKTLPLRSASDDILISIFH